MFENRISAVVINNKYFFMVQYPLPDMKNHSHGAVVLKGNSVFNSNAKSSQ